MRAFGIDELKKIVQLAGQELEREDRYIAGCFARNPVYPARDHEWIPGIYYLKDERYYQRVVARALLASFAFRVKLEEPHAQGHFDLALYSTDPVEQIAVGEMKVCMKNGWPELGSIKNDMRKLREKVCGKFLVIFTMSPRGETDGNVKDLLRRLQCSEDSHHVSSFNSVYNNGRGHVLDGEFAVIGILLK